MTVVTTVDSTGTSSQSLTTVLSTGVEARQDGGRVEMLTSGNTITIRVLDAANNVLDTYSVDGPPNQDAYTLPNGDTVVVYATYSNGIYSVTVSADTGQISAPQLISNGFRPSVAGLPDGGYVLGWSNAGLTTLQIIDADGQSGASATLPSIANAKELDLTPLANGGFAAVVRNTDSAYVVTFDGDGAVTSTTIFGDTTELSSAQRDVAIDTLDDGGFVVVVETDVGVTTRAFNADGTARGPAVVVESAMYADDPDVLALSHGGFIVSWSGNGGEQRAQLFDDQGVARGDPFHLPNPGGAATAENRGQLTELADGTLFLAVRTYSASANTFFYTPSVAVPVVHSTGDIANDTILGDDNFRDVVDGGGGNDAISGRRGNDQLFGNAGNDVINGGEGNDALDGGDGVDTATYAGAVSGVTVRLDTTAAQITGGAGTDTLANFENLIGSSFADTLTGNAAANVLNGGAGADVLTGGLGDDTYYVDNAGDQVIEDAGAGTDTVLASVTFNGAAAQAVGIENITLTGSANVNALGNGLANVLTGNSGRNGLNGGAGADRLVGGLGDDTYTVDDAGDVVVELAGQGVDLVRSSVTFDGSVANSIGIENITLIGSAAINAAGNALDNVLTGNSANNGLNGGRGADTLIGGLGNDTYTIDSTLDVITELAGQGTDTVKSAISFTLSANLENLTLVTSRAINAMGNAGVNVIVGNEGANIIAGKGGADMLTGGAGADTFDYNTTSESSYSAYDRITDLTNSDKIDLSGIDANSGLAGNQAFSLVGAFTNHAGEMTLKYDAAKGFTVLAADVNGDGVADMRIVINGDHHTFTNFVF